MAKYDYSRPLATARRLIERFGRPISLQGVQGGPADHADPLGGPAAAPVPIVGIYAAFVQPSSLQLLGISAKVQELFANCTQIAIIADNGKNNFLDAKYLIDNSDTWMVERVEQLKPGDTSILYFIGVVSP